MRTNEPKTPLLALLRGLTEDQREAFAADAGTSVSYLYSLASCTRKQCKAALASRIAAASKRLAEATRLSDAPTAEIDVETLGTMCDCA